MNFTFREAKRSEAGKGALPFPLCSAYGVRPDGIVVNLKTGLPLRPAIRNGSGYLAVALYSSGKLKSWFVHQIVALTFHGPRPSPKHHASHNDGNKLHNHQDNIRWKTKAENERDKIAHGVSNRGDRNGMSKVSIARRAAQ